MKTMITTLFAALAGLQALAEPTPIDVYKTSTCGCCTAWMSHLGEEGFAPNGRDVEYDALTRFKQHSGVTPSLASCHTARIAGYVIEGHVPAQDIRRLLETRPEAIGLAVPQMPLGSPGMEMGDSRDAFDVLLIRADGSSEVFASYPAN
ncbi:hypothetical protein C8N32_10739 [Rhodovulum imhoffii]|uniref:Metal-binding protein n=1 Tax=Rhodovulum imhoffii TaxID=365340 RepID=A0A2T5BSL9_9RHOB|nr:DUF411 domain-containing protein [Rhodovulum imhoffii]MBK5933490.1 hypothetical protein [Rhodovulum imhoffii]PTN02273.1 hypothetical protein C8N32_10739 [Rhodovulum imhoffii]